MAWSADELRAFVAEARRPDRLFPDVDDVLGSLRLPPPLAHVADMLPTFRGQYRRNGLDGFVWNYRHEIPALIDAFEHIGARATAALMGDILASILDESDGERAADDPVRAFLSLRESRGGPAFGPWLDVDPIDEVHEAILAYVERHADELVAVRG